MSLLEPPDGLESDLPDEEEVELLPVPDAALTPLQYVKAVCANCYRPVVDINGHWKHWDPRIDMPENQAFCVAELYVEPPIAWGQQDRKANYEVNQGPSKVRSGWSGGGVA